MIIESVQQRNQIEASEEPLSNVATVYSVSSAGIRLILAGETEPSSKLYPYNRTATFYAGQRVHLCREGSSVVVEYPISGGVNMGDNEYVEPDDGGGGGGVSDETITKMKQDIADAAAAAATAQETATSAVEIANGKANSSHTHNYAGSSSAGGAATSANKLNTNAGSATQPVYFSNGVPVKTTYTLGKSVPSDAKFTDTTYSTGNASTSGIGKLYTGTGSNTDGSMTQNAITTALSGKAASSHTHSYVPTAGGTMSGQLTIGTAPTADTTANGISVRTDAMIWLRSTGNPAIRAWRSGGSYYQQLRWSTAQTKDTTVNMPAGAGTLSVASSDVRLKANIKPSIINALDVINRLRPVEYDWIDDGYSPRGRHWPVGLVADEMEQVDPLLALGGDSDDPEDYKSPNMWYLQGYLVKAVQELSAEVEALKARVAELEARA